MADSTQIELLRRTAVGAAGEAGDNAGQPRTQHKLQDYLTQEPLLAMKIAQEAATVEQLRTRKGKGSHAF